MENVNKWHRVRGKSCIKRKEKSERGKESFLAKTRAGSTELGESLASRKLGHLGEIPLES